MSIIGKRLQPWMVCFSAALFFFFEFLQLNMFNVIGPGISQSFQVDARVLATISDKYFLANILFIFPAGMLLDRVSTRNVVLVCMAISVLCTFGFSAADAVWQLKLARFFTGVVASFCLLSCVRLASRWFAPKQMALVIGLIVTFAMLGGMLAQTPFALLMGQYGWRATVFIDATVGVLLLVVMFLFIEDRPAEIFSHYGPEPTALHGKAFWRSLSATVRNKQNWFCGLYTSMMNFPVFLFGAIWGVFYLTQVHQLSSDKASFITSLFFVGIILGCPTVGWISDHLQKRKLPMIIGAILALLLILILMTMPNLSFFSSTTLFFSLGFITSTQILGYPVIAESNPLMVTATAEGLAAVLIMGGGFTQRLFAYLLGIHWSHQYVHGVPFYSLTDYRIGMMIMPVAFFLSLILALCIKETRCRPYAESNA